MLRQVIKYTDFHDREVEEVAYFNLTKNELLEMEGVADGGLSHMLTRLIETKDVREIMAMFKALVLKAYGVKSDDGRRFIKVVDGKPLADQFVDSAAYDQLMIDMLETEDTALTWLAGVLPKDMSPDLDAAKAAIAKGEPLDVLRGQVDLRPQAPTPPPPPYPPQFPS